MVWTIPVGEVAGMMIVSFSTGGQPPAADEVPVQTPSTRATTTAPAETEKSVTAPSNEEPRPPLLPEAPSGPAPEPTITTSAAPVPDPFPSPVTESPPVATSAPTLPPLGAEEIRPEVDDEVPGPAVPKPQRLLRPSDKRRFFSMSIGGATAGGYGAYYGRSVDFQVEGLIGAFSKRRPNFGGGFVFQYRKGLISELGLAGRFVWDKSLSDNHAISSQVDTTIGINFPIGIGGYLYPGIPSAQIGVGWGLRAIVADRIALGFRPVAPSLVAPSFYGGTLPVRIRWDFGVSMGIVW